VIPLSVAQVAEITGAVLDAVPDARVLVTGPVVIDSRAARPGSLFAALPGLRVDGHDYAAAAAAAGPSRSWPPARAVRLRCWSPMSWPRWRSWPAPWSTACPT
jgi:UDP-N-acetylmuramyl pentapeptide synthase